MPHFSFSACFDAIVLKLDSFRIIQNKILYKYMQFTEYKRWCNRHQLWLSASKQSFVFWTLYKRCKDWKLGQFL